MPKCFRTLIPAILLAATAFAARSKDALHYESQFIRIELAHDQPAFIALCVDSLGKHKLSANPLRPPRRTRLIRSTMWERPSSICLPALRPRRRPRGRSNSLPARSGCGRSSASQIHPWLWCSTSIHTLTTPRCLAASMRTAACHCQHFCICLTWELSALLPAPPTRQPWATTPFATRKARATTMCASLSLPPPLPNLK